MNYDVEKLLKTREKLSEATNLLNTAINAFEQELKTIGMGVPVSVKISETVFLKYCRCNGEWRVMIAYTDVNDKEIIQPLVESTRTIRLHGYKHRMELLPALEAAAESLAERMKKALE
jgi:hypothetical protein